MSNPRIIHLKSLYKILVTQNVGNSEKEIHDMFPQAQSACRTSRSIAIGAAINNILDWSKILCLIWFDQKFLSRAAGPRLLSFQKSPR